MRNFLVTTAIKKFTETEYEMNIIKMETYPDRRVVFEEVKKQNVHATWGTVIAISELSEQDVIDYNKPPY